MNISTYARCLKDKLKIEDWKGFQNRDYMNNDMVNNATIKNMRGKLLIITLILSSLNIYSQEDNAIGFTFADTPPITSDCDPNLNNKKLKVCFIKSITNQVLSNFNSSLLQNQGLKPGTYRIYATFTVNKKGKVIKVKTDFENKSIAKEIVQAVKSVKKMTPAYLDEKPVSINYTLPIKFKVN